MTWNGGLEELSKLFSTCNQALFRVSQERHEDGIGRDPECLFLVNGAALSTDRKPPSKFSFVFGVDGTEPRMGLGTGHWFYGLSEVGGR